MEEPVWVIERAVLAIHERQIAEHGGSPGIRDYGLLDSALNRAKNLFHYNSPAPSLAEMAAAYAFAIARNHPFIDGNKRTAFVSCELFLRLNAISLIASQQEKYSIFIELAAGNLPEHALAEWIANKCLPGL